MESHFGRILSTTILGCGDDSEDEEEASFENDGEGRSGKWLYCCSFFFGFHPETSGMQEIAGDAHINKKDPLDDIDLEDLEKLEKGEYGV